MRALLLLSPRPLAGKTTVAAALAERLRREGRSVHLSRLGRDDPHYSADSALFSRLSTSQDPASADFVLLEAPAGPPEGAPQEPPGAGVLLVAGPETAADDMAAYARALGGRLQGVVLNRAPKRRLEALRSQAEAQGLAVLGVVTEERLLASPTLGEVARALAAETLFFDSRAEALLDNTLIAPISADPGQGYFARLGANSVIVRSDKPDLQLAALNAGATCLIVTGGLPILHYVRERAEADEIPIISTQMETLDAVKAIEELYAGTPFSGSREKMRRLDEAASLDLSRLLAA